MAIATITMLATLVVWPLDFTRYKLDIVAWKSEACGTYEEVFSYENLYNSGKKCIRGVLWKASTQNYTRKRISNTYRIYEKVQNRKFKFSKPYIFYINERGKTRKIQAQKIEERIVQRTLCDNVIVPIYDSTFIYDNAANRIGKVYKGTSNKCIL